MTCLTRHLGPFLSLLPVFGGCGREREEADVGGAGKRAPLSHVSSEGGDRGMVGRGKKETPLRLAF